MMGRLRRIRRTLLTAAAILIFAGQSQALAEGLPLDCVLVAEDVGNGYQYNISGIGSFSANCSQGETVSAVVITLDGNCTARLYKDGYETDFNDGIIFDNGSYELRVYRKGNEEGSYGFFPFTVQNSYGEMFANDRSSMEIIKNPEMELAVDSSSSMFVYTLPDGETIRSNVPQGGMADMAARIEVSGKLNIYRILRNGEPIDYSQGTSFDRPGSYLVTIWDNEMGLNGKTSYKIDYCFTLYGQGARNINYVNAPMGFYTSQVVKDGQDIPVDSRDYVRLTEDGEYRLVFAQKDGNARWTMNVQRDTTPPCLNFLQDMNPGGEIKEDVSYIPSEPGTLIEVYRNGMPVETSGNLIVLNGDYRVIVSDSVGNEREYRFVIRRGYNIITKEWIIIPPILLMAAVGTAFYWRRNMRVL